MILAEIRNNISLKLNAQIHLKLNEKLEMGTVFLGNTLLLLFL